MQQPIRGLVFDKDGTLFDFHATWSVWCDGLIRDLCGPDPAQVERARPPRSTSTSTPAASPPTSPMIAGTMEVIIDAVREVLPDSRGARAPPHDPHHLRRHPADRGRAPRPAPRPADRRRHDARHRHQRQRGPGRGAPRARRHPRPLRLRRRLRQRPRRQADARPAPRLLRPHRHPARRLRHDRRQRPTTSTAAAPPA